MGASRVMSGVVSNLRRWLRPWSTPPDARALGRLGERAAERYLKRRCRYRTLRRNARIPGGEIDLVMQSPDGAVVFVEVKTRRRDDVPGEHSLTLAKRRRIVQLAQRLARREGWTNRPLQVDVVAIVWNGPRDLEIRHHPTAFGADAR